MSLYGRLFASMYDRLLSGAERKTLGAHRKALLGDAAGRVLEIGAGTGANLSFYGDTDALVLTEPEEPMARRLERRLADQGVKAEVVRAPAEQLPFADASFDTVVATLVLCTVADQPRALAEMHRVLKPGGRLLFIEHVRSDDPGLARWQDRFNGLQQRIGHGCNCNRATVPGIRSAGFTITELEQDEMKPGPPIIRPLAVGTAVR